jgi:hypothetical protein
MRFLLVLFVSFLVVSVQADESFDRTIYTPEVVIDARSSTEKGAVQLLWQKGSSKTRYEVEVSNGRSVYSRVGEKHFHHVMLFFDKDYQWRVREVSAEHTTEFSPWRPLKVVRSRGLVQTDSESLDPEVDLYVLDTGAD